MEEESEEIIIEKEKIEVTPKIMGKEFKKFIKENSNDYLLRLKEEIFKNFKIYYEYLNNQITEEQNNQEKQQKELVAQIESKNKLTEDINNTLSRRQKILLTEKEHKHIIVFIKIKSNKKKKIKNLIILIKSL